MFSKQLYLKNYKTNFLKLNPFHVLIPALNAPFCGSATHLHMACPYFSLEVMWSFSVSCPGLNKPASYTSSNYSARFMIWFQNAINSGKPSLVASLTILLLLVRSFELISHTMAIICYTSLRIQMWISVWSTETVSALPADLENRASFLQPS